MQRMLMTMVTVLAAAALASAQSTPAPLKKVVITSSGTYYSPLGPAEINELRAAAPQVNLVAPPPDRILAEITDADGVIGVITPEMLRAAKKLTWVQVGVAGVERFLSPELVNSNIVLTNCKLLQGPEIGDHAMALLLALTRELHRSIPRRTREEWATRDYAPVELLGKSAVVVGVGGIGTQIAVRAKAFGMYVIGLDVKDIPPAPFLDRVEPPDRLDAVLPEADVVFVAAPSTSATRHMFSQRQFALMKRRSYFIVVSRGSLYDGMALAAAIQSQHLAGAGLDVTEPEPLPPGHPLWKFENVIITPHTAGRSDGEHRRYIELFKDNLQRFAAGLPLRHVVDKQKGY